MLKVSANPLRGRRHGMTKLYKAWSCTYAGSSRQLQLREAEDRVGDVLREYRHGIHGCVSGASQDGNTSWRGIDKPQLASPLSTIHPGRHARRNIGPRTGRSSSRGEAEAQAPRGPRRAESP